MEDSDDIVIQLEKEIKDIEYKIENRKKYNNSKRFKYILFKSLLLLEMAFPFIIGTTFTSFIFYGLGKTPIKKTKIIDKSSIQYQIESNGNESKLISYDEEYTNNSIEYSTGWFLNDNGMFERDITVYKFDIDEIKLNYDDILSLSKEELNQIFEIIDIKKIQKNKLDEKDNKYENQYIIINQVIDEDEYYRIKTETNFENFFEMLTFIFLVYFEGIILENLSGLVIKKTLSTKFGYIVLENRPISKKEIATLEKILELKKENLELLKQR